MMNRWKKNLTFEDAMLFKFGGKQEKRGGSFESLEAGNFENQIYLFLYFCVQVFFKLVVKQLIF